MSTPLLKRRLNPFLLASTVLVLSLLAGLSVMYQGQLSQLVDTRSDLSSELEQKNQRLSKLQEENSELRSSLRNINTRLNQSIRESENLQRKVNNLESENSELETRIENLSAEVGNLSETVDEVNESLEYVCEVNDNNLTEESQEHCNYWGHEVP